ENELNVVDAFDIEYAGNPLHAADDSLELFPVRHIDRHFNSSPQAVRAPALERADIGSRVADNSCDRGNHPRVVFRGNAQPNGERRLRRIRPLDWDAPLGLIQQVFAVWARLAVNRDAAPTCYVA